MNEADQQEEWVAASWLMAHYAISAPTVWRWVKTKKLPQPVKLGPNTTRWKRKTLQEWEQARAQPAGSTA